MPQGASERISMQGQAMVSQDLHTCKPQILTHKHCVQGGELSKRAAGTNCCAATAAGCLFCSQVLVTQDLLL
jgi:hypothetical protein